MIGDPWTSTTCAIAGERRMRCDFFGSTFDTANMFTRFDTWKVSNIFHYFLTFSVFILSNSLMKSSTKMWGFFWSVFYFYINIFHNGKTSVFVYFFLNRNSLSKSRCSFQTKGYFFCDRSNDNRDFIANISYPFAEPPSQVCATGS